MLELILSALLVMCASLVGVVAVWRQAGTFIERNLGYLISFSAGVFLVIIYQLSGEVLEHASSPLVGLGWILFGALLLSALVRFMPALHQHSTHALGRIDPRRVLISDSVHNLGDGLLLAGAFVASPVLGAGAAISIFMHELVQEVSEFFVLRSGGYSTRRALVLNFAVSGFILVGAVGGYVLLDLFEWLEVPLLGIAAGAFLVVVLHDLIPHSLRHAVEPLHYAKHLLWFAVGLVIMFGVSNVVSHAHETEEVHVPGEEEHLQ